MFRLVRDILTLFLKIGAKLHKKNETRKFFEYLSFLFYKISMFYYVGLFILQILDKFLAYSRKLLYFCKFFGENRTFKYG